MRSGAGRQSRYAWTLLLAGAALVEAPSRVQRRPELPSRLRSRRHFVLRRVAPPLRLILAQGNLSLRERLTGPRERCCLQPRSPRCLHSPRSPRSLSEVPTIGVVWSRMR